MVEYLKHAAILIGAKIPLSIISKIVLIPVTYKYRLGQFPNKFKWLDDYRGRYLEQLNRRSRDVTCDLAFGKGHCELYKEYNSTWKGRYIWSAWRNSTNYFNHAIIGVKEWPLINFILDRNNRLDMYPVHGKRIAWEYSRYNGNEIKIPLVPLWIRLRVGYKLGDAQHVENLREIGIPLEFAASIGLRTKNNK